MGRLIDADELKKNIAKWLKPSSPDEREMVTVDDIAISVMIEIEEQPTAFDVDKVVKQLKEIAKQEDSPIYEVDKAVDAWVRLCEVIEAVKGAVKDE